MLPDRLENTNDLTLSEITYCISSLDKQFNGDSDQTAYLSVCLAGEVGELLNVVKRWMASHQGVISRPKSDFKEKFTGECGDIFLYFFSLMKHLGVDPSEAFEVAWAKVQERLKGDYYKYGAEGKKDVS